MFAAARTVTALVRERLSPALLRRTPESSSEMRGEAAEAFHRQGTNLLLPVYHLNAVSISALVPRGGVVLDLGAGSGRFARYLAHGRPDLKIVGIDLSEDMLRLGREEILQTGLGDRVELVHGDMCDSRTLAPPRVDAVISILSLHHLPDEATVARCLEGISELRRRTGCAVWLYDLARFHHPETPTFIASTLQKQPKAYVDDYQRSLRAAYSYQELTRLVNAAGFGDVQHRQSRLIPSEQVHWVGRRNVARSELGRWSGAPGPSAHAGRFKLLSWMLDGTPVEAPARSAP